MPDILKTKVLEITGHHSSINSCNYFCIEREYCLAVLNANTLKNHKSMVIPKVP